MSHQFTKYITKKAFSKPNHWKVLLNHKIIELLNSKSCELFFGEGALILDRDHLSKFAVVDPVHAKSTANIRSSKPMLLRFQLEEPVSINAFGTSRSRAPEELWYSVDDGATWYPISIDVP